MLGDLHFCALVSSVSMRKTPVITAEKLKVHEPSISQTFTNFPLIHFTVGTVRILPPISRTLDFSKQLSIILDDTVYLNNTSYCSASWKGSAG